MPARRKAAADGRPKAAPAGATGTGGAGGNLAETGGDSGTPYIAVGGAAALAPGSAALFAAVRRQAVSGGRYGR
ncbi:LAETG motif-containing sortase-dependent surface protein [Streptomyces sp. NPDC002309]